MAVAQRTRARMERRSRRQGALIAGAVMALCLIAVPVELLELGIASVGLSELLPVLGPPIGWPVRTLLVLVGAALAAGLSAGLGGSSTRIAPGRIKPGRKGNGSMGWTKSLGLHHLARLARGEDSASDAPTARPRAPAFPRPELVGGQDALPRRRGDMHPDAPPRAPLMASRDLPLVSDSAGLDSTPVALTSIALTPVALAMVDTGPASAPPPVQASYVSPVRDTTHEARPRPLPRSPEPLSDSDLGWVRDVLATRDAQGAARASTAPLAEAAPTAETPPAPAVDGSLLSMVDRFEQGVSRRIALRDAATAIARVDGGATPAAPAPAEPIDEAQEIDDALGAALETLKKLSAKAG